MTTKKTPIGRTALLVLAALALLGIFVLLLWRGPWWFDGAHLRTKDLQPADGVVITGFRTVLVAVGVAVTAALGLVYTHRSHRTALDLLEHTRAKDREQADLVREGQLTDRYVDAIKLLSASGDEGLTERLGGIYALERIMIDSAKDHPTVVQVLAAFVRQRAVPERISEWSRPPKDDVQAALTALGRRPVRDEAQTVDLHRAGLPRCDLRMARLRDVDLSGADLRHADLTGADLRGARLSNADLTGALLHRADLRHASLSEGGNAHLAVVSVDQLRWAVTDEGTILPHEMYEELVQLHRLKGKGGRAAPARFLND
ncbi:pentapeptide repeat-containing protein [Streptomyces sp. NPDC049916]|uniref:pentapeptide repeat-containing protein n=1 Tax=Streptomyces sp. NPDC049916 TaxID=3155156 RepID=UPI00341AED5F